MKILYSWEKEGSAPRSLGCMKDFQDCLYDFCLEELGYTGDTFYLDKRKTEGKIGPSCRQRYLGKFVSELHSW
jgi:hypothetical protein